MRVDADVARFKPLATASRRKVNARFQPHTAQLANVILALDLNDDGRQQLPRESPIAVISMPPLVSFPSWMFQGMQWTN